MFWIAMWLIVTNLKIDTRACKVTHQAQGHTLNYWIKMADDQHWLRNTKRSLLDLYWSSGKGLNTNKHVNGFLLKYSIVQNVSKCLIRLSPHDVSTSISKKKYFKGVLDFFFSFFFYISSRVVLQITDTFIHFWQKLSAIKRILPLTGGFNVKWMVNGSVFKPFLQ